MSLQRQLLRYCLLVLVAFVVVLWGWINLEESTTKQVLSVLSVRVLDVALVLLLAGLLCAGKEHWRHALERAHSHRWPLGLLLALGIALQCLPAKTSRILFDEQIYQNVALNIAHRKVAAVVQHGEAELGEYKVFDQTYNKEPNGYPYGLALWYQIFGASPNAALWFNASCYLAFSLSLRWLALVLGLTSITAWLAAFLSLLVPELLRWSSTAAAEPCAALAAVLMLASVGRLAHGPTRANFLIALGLSTWALQCRPESILLVPLSIACWGTVASWRSLLGLPALRFAVCSALLGAPLLLHLLSVSGESWGAEGSPRFAFSYFAANFRENALFFVLNERFPLFLSIAALIGMVVLKRTSTRVFLALWFGSFWGIFLFFYAGSYAYGADVRFSVLCCAPVLLLAASGIDWLRRIGTAYFPGSSVVLLGAALVSYLELLPYIRSLGEEGVIARSDTDFARQSASLLPDNSIVISQVPSLWLIEGRNSAEAFLTRSQPLRVQSDFFRRYKGGVFFHWGAWCNFDNRPQNELCTEILQKYESRLLIEKSLFGFPYKLYQLSGPASSADDIQR